MQNPSPVTFPETSPNSEDELDLLDLLLTLVENWKLLLIAPLVVGLAALGISFALPKTYQSESLLQVERAGSAFTAPVAASLAMSADVLRTIAPAAGLEADLSDAAIHKKLGKRIQVTIGKQDRLLKISAQAASPEQAQKLNQTLLDTLAPFSKPQGLDKEQLEAQLASERKRLQESEKLEQRTSAELASGRAVTEGSSRLYGELLAANSARQRTILDLERRLAGITQDDIVQAPTLPDSSIKPKKSLIAIAATLGSGFALLLFVFARQAMRSATENSPEQAAKIAKIRQALPW